MLHMAQFFWKIFMLTGNLDAYLLYKQIMGC
ncbi:YqzL family protein [Paramaledivibacter caminithermalis]